MPALGSGNAYMDRRRAHSESLDRDVSCARRTRPPMYLPPNQTGVERLVDSTSRYVAPRAFSAGKLLYLEVVGIDRASVQDLNIRIAVRRCGGCVQWGRG